MDDVQRQVMGMVAESFEGLAEHLRPAHPAARFFVTSLPIGSATSFQGFSFYLECFWPHALSNGPDHVVLEVQLCHLTSAPRVNADVCWADGCVEAEFDSNWSTSEDWPEATPEVLQRLEGRLPSLMRAFEAAVKRGQPGNENAG